MVNIITSFTSFPIRRKVPRFLILLKSDTKIIPIRIEWVTISGTPRKNDKNESISVSVTRRSDGSIKIPNFDQEGSIIQGGELFNYSNLTPRVIEYWESWVRENRPC